MSNTDNELRIKVENIFNHYDVGDFAQVSASPVTSIIDLIRNEKLKLLAEVRERKHLYNVKSTDGEMNKPNTGIFAIPVTELAELEAEL